MTKPQGLISNTPASEYKVYRAGCRPLGGITPVSQVRVEVPGSILAGMSDEGQNPGVPVIVKLASDAVRFKGIERIDSDDTAARAGVEEMRHSFSPLLLDGLNG